MATLDDSPITIASPQDITSSEYDAYHSPTSPSPTQAPLITKLEPISAVSPRAKFKQRMNKIKFKRKPSLVRERSVESPSLSDTHALPSDPQDSGVNMTSDVTHDDTSLDDVMNEYQEFTGEASEEAVLSGPTPSHVVDTDTFDSSVYSDNVLSIRILGSDPLKPHISLSHPLLKVTLYCDKTCTHLKKSEKTRAVSSFYETENEAVDYILPQLTAPAVVSPSNNFTPHWGEELVFNEDLSYLLSSPTLVLLFELMEFKERTLTASLPKRQGWRHIAWAFLKLRGANNRVNLEQKLRLQFYRYPKRQFAGSRDNLGFNAWYHGYRVKYPSTLHVTARAVRIECTIASLRSCAPNQPERAAARENTADASQSRTPSSWSRKEGQTCLVPNTPLLLSPLAGHGGSVLKFSPDGNCLAVGVSVAERSEVWLYAVPSCEEMRVLRGHQGLIYDLAWSPSSTLLMTASQDTTARVWSLPDTERDTCYKILSHPSYVYACSFHPSSELVLLTAGYDRVIKVWGIAALGVNSGQILRELRSHAGYINCLMFDAAGVKLFSGDSEGCVYVWQVYLSRGSGEEVEKWRELDKIHLREIMGVGIRGVFPVDRRLVVHTCDGALRLIVFKRQSILSHYPVDSPETHPLSRCSLSPCLSSVYIGSATELCVLCVDTGRKTHGSSLQQLTLPAARIVCVHYHPLDHMLALCTYGASGSLLVSRHTPQLNPSPVSLADTPLPLARPPVSGDTLSDTAMVVLKERVRERLNSICLDPPVPPTATGMSPLSDTWDSLGSLTVPLARDRIFTPESVIEEPAPADCESVHSHTDSKLSLEMLQQSTDSNRVPHTPTREHTPIYSTSELEEADYEAVERAKRSLARRRRSVHKQRIAKMQSVE